MNLKTFQEYHKEALNLIEEITDLLNSQKLDPIKIYSLVSVFGALSKKYFDVLLPEFLKSSNPQIQNLAEEDSNIINELAHAYDKYFKSWDNYSKVQNNPQGFCFETREYLSISQAKIALEMQKIYPISE